VHRFTVFTLTALLLLAAGCSSLKTAEDHSQMLADPITAAIVQQFPDKLGN